MAKPSDSATTWKSLAYVSSRRVLRIVMVSLRRCFPNVCSEYPFTSDFRCDDPWTITFTRGRKTDGLFSFSFLFCSISSSVSDGVLEATKRFWILCFTIRVCHSRCCCCCSGWFWTNGLSLSLSLSLSWTLGFKDFFATLIARYMVLAVAEALGDTKGESWIAESFIERETALTRRPTGRREEEKETAISLPNGAFMRRSFQAFAIKASKWIPKQSFRSSLRLCT